MLVGTEIAALACWNDAEASASSDASASCYGSSENILVLAVVVTKLKLCEVQRQILLGYMMVGADNPALQQRPERFDVVGVDLATHIFVLGVLYAVVFVAQRIQVVVAAKVIGCDQANAVTDGLADEAVERSRISVLNDLADHITLAADSADYRGLTTHSGDVLLLIPVAILVLPADGGFVNFNDTHQLAELGIVHRGAQAMRHVPRRASRRGFPKEHPSKLTRGNTLLTFQHGPENAEPRQQRILSILENGSGNDGESITSLAALLTLPVERARLERPDLFVSATRASDLAVRPASIRQVLTAGSFGRERGHKFVEVHHG